MPHTLTVATSDRRLAFVFQKSDDRWSHCVILESGGQWTPFLRSVESNAHDDPHHDGQSDRPHDWPPSPPLQDASIHLPQPLLEITLPNILDDAPEQDAKHGQNGQAVLGVGQAGKSHWSASFSRSPGNRIIAELACLPHPDHPAAPDDFIGSTYQLSPGVQARIQEPGNLILSHQAGQLQVTVEPGTGGPSLLSHHPPYFSVRPAGHAVEKRKPIQWAYQFEIKR